MVLRCMVHYNIFKLTVRGLTITDVIISFETVEIKSIAPNNLRFQPGDGSDSAVGLRCVDSTGRLLHKVEL